MKRGSSSVSGVGEGKDGVNDNPRVEVSDFNEAVGIRIVIEYI